jgi:hypothetical protein
MMPLLTAEARRQYFRNISGSLSRSAAQGDATLASCRYGHTIYVQRVIVYITTDAAQSWVFEDESATVKVCEVPASPGDETRWDFDFGDEGKPLTEGEDLVLNASAAGLAGHIEYYGYMKQTATISAAQSASGAA